MKMQHAKIPFTHFGGSGQVLHFAHANGFPPACYQPMLAPFTQTHQVVAMHQRPLWVNAATEGIRTWETLSDDLILFFEENNWTNVVGVGHSLGAIVTAIAAAKRPDLFHRIILLDPVLFPRRYYWLRRMAPGWAWRKFFPIVGMTLNRKDRWPSMPDAYRGFRDKKVFSMIPDEHFPAFVKGCVQENPDGTATLIYSKEWEAHIYCTPADAWPFLRKLKVPTQVVRGGESVVLTAHIWERWKKAQPGARFHVVENTTHLLPLENPSEMVALIGRGNY